MINTAGRCIAGALVALTVGAHVSSAQSPPRTPGVDGEWRAYGRDALGQPLVAA